MSLTDRRLGYPISPCTISSVTAFTSKNCLNNYWIEWKQQPNVLFYNIFCSNYYIGRVYGSGETNVSNDNMYYIVTNKPSGDNNFWIQYVDLEGNKVNPHSSCGFDSRIEQFTYDKPHKKTSITRIVTLIVLFIILTLMTIYIYRNAAHRCAGIIILVALVVVLIVILEATIKNIYYLSKQK